MARFKHANVRLSDAAFAVELLGGEEGIRALRAAHGDTFPGSVKYGNQTFGQIEAFINNCGGNGVIDGNLRGEKELTIRDVVPILFDKHGRRIPPRGFQAKVCDPNRGFRLVQPTIDYAARLARLHNAFEGMVKLPSSAEYEDSCRKLLGEQMAGDPSIVNAIGGVHLPWVMPQMEVSDHGLTIENLLVAVIRSYEAEFPKRKFRNYYKGRLQGRVMVIPKSRHDLLVERLKAGPVFGVQFPNCLQGFSLRAQREQMETLSPSFILSGLDTLITMMIYPDVLARDPNTPTLDLAAYQSRSSESSFFLKEYDYNLDFSYDTNLDRANGDSSGSLSFLG